MTRCPHCGTELERDHIGRARTVLLCEHCNVVFPVEGERHLSSVPELRKRRDTDG